MKIYIHSSGDKSVGLPSLTVTIDYPIYLDIEYRTELRKSLEEFWEKELDNGKIYVQFEGECFDCGKVIEKCVCLPYELEETYQEIKNKEKDYCNVCEAETSNDGLGNCAECSKEKS